MPVAEEGLVEPRGCCTATRAAHAVVRDLRRVDADVADPFDVAIDPDVDRVAVIDVE